MRLLENILVTFVTADHLCTCCQILQARLKFLVLCTLQVSLKLGQVLEHVLHKHNLNMYYINDTPLRMVEQYRCKRQSVQCRIRSISSYM